MSLTAKVIATIKTRWQQFMCNHGPWIRDRYKTDGKRTCHCQQCWRIAFQNSFEYKLSRNEMYEEWMTRAVAGGMSLEAADQFWHSNLQFD